MSVRSTILILAVLAAAGCAATGPAKPAGTDPLRSTADRINRERQRVIILSELAGYYRDLSARDWDGVASHFWRGAVVTTVWQPDGESERRVDFISVPEFIAAIDPGPDGEVFFEEHLTNAEVHFEGNVAVVWAEYQARLGEPGDIRQWTGIDAFTLIKHVGIWKSTSMAFAAE